MRRDGALVRAVLVAKAAVHRHLTAAAIGTAISLMLGLSGCVMSHDGGTDADGDGYGADIDCDDGDARIHPDATEPPAGWDCCVEPATDFDCDGVPIACACNPFPDADGDGSPSWEDCDDADPNVYPGAPEVGEFPECCEGGGADMNCDGAPPLCACNPFPDDVDGDGWSVESDCDDEDATINPGALEPPCPDGVDQNCDAIDGDPAARCAGDVDGDGFDVTIDCDDADPHTYPGAPEGTCSDGIDQDCDGVDGDPNIICNGMADAPEDDLDHA